MTACPSCDVATTDVVPLRQDRVRRHLAPARPQPLVPTWRLRLRAFRRRLVRLFLPREPSVDQLSPRLLRDIGLDQPPRERRPFWWDTRF